MPDYDSFLNKLIAKSEEGRIPWKPAYDSDAFLASIENEFTVIILKGAKQTYTLQMRDQQDHKLINLTAENRKSWEPGYEESDECFDRLRRLYEAAGIVALDVQNKLTRAESLLDRLEK